MTFTESIKTCLFKKPFVFSGRGSRSEYWWFWLFTFLIEFLLELLHLPDMIDHIIKLIILLPMIGASIRRLHDSNLSGWFILLNFFGFIIPLYLFTISVNLLILSCILLVSINIYLYCRKSTPGRNKYGDVPEDILLASSLSQINNNAQTMHDDKINLDK